MDLGARIAQPIQYLQSALGAADAGDIERHDQQDIVGQVESRDRNRIKSIRQIKHDALKPAAQYMKDLSYAFGFDLVCFMRFERRRQQRQIRRVGSNQTGNQRIIQPGSVADKVGD